MWVHRVSKSKSSDPNNNNNMRAHSVSLATALLLLITHGVDAGYAPVQTTCPTTALVRPATGLSDEEATFRRERKRVADEALKTWLAKTNPGFQYNDGSLPTVGSVSQSLPGHNS